MEKILTEMQCLERLTEIAEQIEREGWIGIWHHIDNPFFAEAKKLREVLAEKTDTIKELNQSLQDLRIKIGALNDLMKVVQTFPANTEKIILDVHLKPNAKVSH